MATDHAEITTIRTRPAETIEHENAKNGTVAAETIETGTETAVHADGMIGETTDAEIATCLMTAEATVEIAKTTEAQEKTETSLQPKLEEQKQTVLPRRNESLHLI